MQIKFSLSSNNSIKLALKNHKKELLTCPQRTGQMQIQNQLILSINISLKIENRVRFSENKKDKKNKGSEKLRASPL